MTAANRNVLISIFEAANNIFFDEDEEEGNNNVPKVINYAEEIVTQFSDGQFRQHFRISPSTFENVLIKLQIVNKQNVHGHPEIMLEKQLMITLWCLSNLECFR